MLDINTTIINSNDNVRLTHFGLPCFEETNIGTRDTPSDRPSIVVVPLILQPWVIKRGTSRLRHRRLRKRGYPHRLSIRISYGIYGLSVVNFFIIEEGLHGSS